jgi:hypothetical protein
LTPFPFVSHVRCSDLATALLPRPSVQPPAPTKHVLAPPLRIVILLRMSVKTLCHIRSNINPSSEMAAEGGSIPDPQARVGPVNDERGQDPGADGSWAALAEGGGGVEGCRRGAVPK